MGVDTEYLPRNESWGLSAIELPKLSIKSKCEKLPQALYSSINLKYKREGGEASVRRGGGCRVQMPYIYYLYTEC